MQSGYNYYTELLYYMIWCKVILPTYLLCTYMHLQTNCTHGTNKLFLSIFLSLRIAWFTKHYRADVDTEPFIGVRGYKIWGGGADVSPPDERGTRENS